MAPDRAAWLLLLVACAAGAGCGTASAERIRGWYWQGATGAELRPCGVDSSQAVDSADLRARAKAFDLQGDDPVYVEVEATRAGGRLEVQRVLAFGSTAPVRDCPLTGVVRRP